MNAVVSLSFSLIPQASSEPITQSYSFFNKYFAKVNILKRGICEDQPQLIYLLLLASFVIDVSTYKTAMNTCAHWQQLVFRVMQQLARGKMSTTSIQLINPYNNSKLPI
ncbi:hypothetical protein Tcan_18658 [Toxocara canis]|uniref:Uncharacterized protein n=1 Tax=Toxocara canis TaxID=6265 RepID=A0A0B2VEL8_TOXCA|nr:hypothetical protein Tcan_18658 [Toxocara canis]